MKKHSTRFRVGVKHLDDGEHFSWIDQLKVAQFGHGLLRTQLHIDTRTLKREHDMFFLMRKIVSVDYLVQIRLHEEFEIQSCVWIAGPASLAFECRFVKGDKTLTQMNWRMPLISFSEQRPIRIPSWMVEIIGREKPSEVLAPTSS